LNPTARQVSAAPFFEKPKGLPTNPRPTMKLEELQKHAMELPDSDRAILAADLLVSLPALLVDEDDGMAEARRRSKEFDEDPSIALSWEELKKSLGR
jgi:hypothetical protein